MGKYLDFAGEESGYEQFFLTRENVRKNIGKTICFVRRVDPYRGYYNVEYGRIHSIRFNRLFLNDMDSEIDIRDVKECGIKIETNEK